MRFLQDWKTIILRVQYLGFPRKWASVKAWARHTWYYKDPDAFFCMCAFSLEVARAFFPWNGSFSLKQRKIIAFQKPAEILHKWILQVYILYSSLFLDWGNQEISAVLQSLPIIRRSSKVVDKSLISLWFVVYPIYIIVDIIYISWFIPLIYSFQKLGHNFSS